MGLKKPVTSIGHIQMLWTSVQNPKELSAIQLILAESVTILYAWQGLPLPKEFFNDTSIKGVSTWEQNATEILHQVTAVAKLFLMLFFFGKAFAKALNEWIGVAIGEFLSEIGRLQAEQQKQTRDFQEEVLERAKLAREKAAREALGKESEKDLSSSSQISSTMMSTDSSFVSNSSSLPVVPNSSSSNSEVSNIDST